MAASENEAQVRRALPKEDRRAEIMAAAMKVIGNDPTASLSDIAKEAGVTRQLVSLYFPGGGTGPIVIEMVRGAIELLSGVIGQMGDFAEAFDSADEARVREKVAVAVNGYIDFVLPGAPAWMFGTSRDIGGARVSEEIDSLHIQFTEIVLRSSKRWASNDRAHTVFRAEIYATESIASRYMAGDLARDDAVACLTELWVGLFTQVLPALGQLSSR